MYRSTEPGGRPIALAAPPATQPPRGAGFDLPAAARREPPARVPAASLTALEPCDSMGMHVRCRHESSGVPPMDFHVSNLDLVAAGRSRPGWAERGVPVVRRVRDRVAAERPPAGGR